MISLVIPTVSRTNEYSENLLKVIKEIYPDIEVILEQNDKVTLGTNYNNAVSRATGDKVVLLHNDMVIRPGFVEMMDKHIAPKRITTYTRVEPPIFTDTYPGKYLLDCGQDLQSFDSAKFQKYAPQESLIDGGSQLFFGCMKEDYIGIDGNTFTMFCEDDDLHLRYNLLGFEKKVSSAHVYHFVSKTSRTTPEFKTIEQHSNKNFIRKWGSLNRDSIVKYDIGVRVKNCNLHLLSLVEPWCSTILIEDEMEILTNTYIDQEQKSTTTSLSSKIKTTSKIKTISWNSLSNEIIVDIDRSTFTQQDLEYIKLLPQIIKDNGLQGKFQVGNLLISIDQMNEYQNNLIYL